MGFFPDTVAAQLAGQIVRCDLLVHFQFKTTPMRLWQGFGTLHTNDGNDWQGIGHLGQIGELESAIGGTSPQTTFTLSGVDPGLIADALNSSDEVSNQPVDVLFQYFDENFACLDNPYVLWSGLMDVMRVRQRGPDECVVEVSAEPPFARRTLPPLGNLSDREQQRFFPGDTGCSFIPSLISTAAIWPVIVSHP